jgi:hypothetical protein
VSLDPIQRDILAVAMTLPEAQGMALAGGGAMLAHGLVDRRTQDLDLFSPDSAEIAPAAEALRVALLARGYGVKVERRSDSYVQLAVTGPSDGSTYVELAQDSRRHEPVTLSVGRVLAPDDVAASKTLALFGRAAARDLVDVDALTRRYSQSDLLRLASESDLGFDSWLFADALLVARERADDAFAELGVTGDALVLLRARAAAWAKDLLEDSDRNV